MLSPIDRYGRWANFLSQYVLYAFGKPASHRSTARTMAGWRRIRNYGFIYCAWICTLVKSKAHLGIVQEFAIYGV